MATRRRGQAMTELAVGMFLIAFVVCVLVHFSDFIMKETRRLLPYRIHNSMRFKVDL